MRKYILTLLFGCFITQVGLAQGRYFEWVNPANTLRIKLEPDTHSLWEETKGGVWVKSATVKFDNKIVQDLPSLFDVRSAFYSGDSLVTFTINGLGNVYAYHTRTQTLERLDATFFKGYNFGSSVFMRKDTLFSFGGYGFWHYTNTQTFFDKRIKEWFDYKLNNLGPETIKAGLQGYNAAEDVFYSGWSVYDPGTIGGERKNSSKFYQFDFKTRTWEYLGELNPKLKLANNEEDVYWTGRYFFGWGTKEAYIIDPVQNKVYSTTRIELSFNTKGRFYTKGDTLIYYFPDKGTILKYAIKNELAHADYIGPLYTKNLATSDYIAIGLGMLLVTGLGLFIKQRITRKRNNFFSKQEQTLLSAFIESGSLSTQDMNEVLETATKSFDNQRRIRSLTIKQINQKLLQAYGVPEGIQKQADAEDKRLTIYRLQEGLAEKLAADKRLA
jgi:hypothetical protein